ncbi:unnamed protein product [Vicia faba]|uniref:Uncharacterized protein n=1 Tax=Vicia faba TaxID=3906 RepID=A0AAV1AYL5_VICFA|nr:unnamed protein product [Vicia faba]
MAPKSRFDSRAASLDELAVKGDFSNGQQGNLRNVDSDRPASFRDGNDSRMSISDTSMVQGNSTSSRDSDSFSQYLKLDPITTGGPKYTSLNDLKRALRISHVNTLEDCTFQSGNPKSRIPADPEELKRFKARLQEASARASDKSKRLDESVHKLNKCWEALNSKKQFQNEGLPNERTSGSHLSNMGSQTHQSTTELANKKPEDIPKKIILNAQIRTSAAEIQAEGLNNSFGRQPLTIGKDKDNIEDVGKVCDGVQEKIQRLPVSGETWDRKMKRKHSMRTVTSGSTDGEGEPKRVMYLKQANESGLQSCDAIGLRFDDHGKNYTSGIYPHTKVKASRAPRSGNLIVGNSSSETLDAREQPSNVNQPHSSIEAINHKRPFPIESSMSDLAQWAGQRPQKSSRTRRANGVSPSVFNCDEMPMPFEGCSPSSGTIMTSTTTSGPPTSKGAINNMQCTRNKNDDNSFQTRICESVESGARENGENKLKEKVLDRNKGDGRAINDSCNIGSYMSMTKKEIKLNKEETGDGLHRQCSGSKGFSVLKNGISSTEEKSEILSLTKRTRNTKPSSLKNASRSRRPRMKKPHNSKAIAHLGHPSTSSSPDIAGRSGDDCEELLFAANIASNASHTGCSSLFWKKMEPNFAPVNLEVIDHLKQQVKTIEDDQSYLSQMHCFQSDALDAVVFTNNFFSQYPLEGERGRNILNQSDSKELSSMVDMVVQPHEDSFLSSQMDLQYKLPPLYHRVLTALIIDDQIEETVGDENISFLHERDDPPVGFCTDTVSCSGNATFTCDKMSLEDKLLMELQSVGIYPEQVPELADGGCEAIDQEITQLQKGSCQQLIKKKEGFMKLIQAVEDGRELEQRALEQVAMDKLVEFAYKKKLATRGTIAAKYGISKASRPVALAFMKRTLARCRAFEETRKSCFLDPMFKDVLFATPALDNYTVSTVSDNRPLAQNSRQDFAPPDSFPSREQNVGASSNHRSNLDFARTGPILNGGKKGKVLPDDVGVSTYLGGKKGEVLLDDVGARDYLGGKKGKLLLDDVGASALGGEKEKVLLDDVGASASLGGKKGEVLLDGVGASASLGGKKGEVALDGVGASASLGGKRGEELFDNVGVDAKGEMLLDGVRASTSLGGKKGEVPLDGVRASASLGGRREVLFEDVGVDASASLGGKKGEVLLAGASLGGKKGEVLLEDVGASATLGNSFLSGTTGKRSKRGTNKDTSIRNYVKRGGRSSASNTRSGRKPKAKGKPKTDQLSTSAEGSLHKLVENTNSKHQLACGSDQLVSSGNNNVGSVSHGSSTIDFAFETEDPLDLTNMPELDSIENGADKDLDSWLNIDVDALEDDDDAVGLDIPMDDLFTVL